MPSKKKRVTKKKGAARNPYAPFEKDIVKIIIRPELLGMISDDPSINNFHRFRRAFRSRFSCNVSHKTLAKWLDMAGIEFVKGVRLKVARHTGDAPAPPTNPTDIDQLLHEQEEEWVRADMAKADNQEGEHK